MCRYNPNRIAGKWRSCHIKHGVHFIILEDLGNDSYHVQRYNDADSAIRKYKGTDSYVLPPEIFPSDCLDTMDVRYLNYSNVPIISPLEKALNIEMYNAVYFEKPPISQSASYNNFSCQLDNTALVPPPTPATLSNIDKYTDLATCPPTETLYHSNTGCTHADEMTSNSKLFFFKYTTDITLQERWYLIQVDLDATMDINVENNTIDLYHCVFLAQHPNDMSKSEEISRFWPEWHKHSLCPKTANIIYGDCILLRPSHNPNMNKYIQWSDNIPLLGNSKNSKLIIGPFDFEAINAYNQT